MPRVDHRACPAATSGEDRSGGTRGDRPFRRSPAACAYPAARHLPGDMARAADDVVR